jgi:hypothetical protein
VFFESGGQLQLDEREAGAGAAILNGKNVLVVFGAGAKSEGVVVVEIALIHMDL